MRQLLMKNGSGSEKIVDIDDTAPLGYGGFGTVFPVPLEPKLVVKQVELIPPKPIGDTHVYVAHINTTKERLLGCNHDALFAIISMRS